MAQPKYYSTEAGSDFRAFVEHFRRQADGSERPVIFHDKKSLTSVRNARANRSNLIMVKVRNDEGTTKSGAPVKKIEVVAPSEGEKKRAMAEIVREEVEMTKAVEDYENAQSAIGSRKRKTPSSADSRPKQAATASATKKVRRIKDIFD